MCERKKDTFFVSKRQQKDDFFFTESANVELIILKKKYSKTKRFSTRNTEVQSCEALKQNRQLLLHNRKATAVQHNVIV